MENNYYQVYLETVIQLAEGLVLKSADTADAINQDLLIQYGTGAVNTIAPQTWKYYLNVSGQYHPSNTMMTVVSVDTLQTINFTRENLRDHRGTAKAYIFGGKLYKELVSRYPQQERLIRGILYPCDIQTAIDAQEGTILSYPEHLVESYEYSLIPKLQQWIYDAMSRWHNAQYTLSDDLYLSAMLGMLHMSIVPQILNLRGEQAAEKTNEVHSFHLQQYLASNGLLDQYLAYLTRDQALFLYRNISYVKRNSGKTAVFEWLMEHIMTRRGLPLGDFDMRHNLEEMPGVLKPIVDFRKNPLNTASNYDGLDIFSMNAIYDKEEPLARDNAKYREQEQATSIKKMSYSLSNDLNTKLLESSIIDYTGSEYYTLADILLHHWLHLSHTGHFKAIVSVTNPTNGETIALPANEAFIFFVYANCVAAQGVTLQELPIVTAWRVIRTPKPTVDDLMEVATEANVPRSFASEILNILPVPQPMISVDSFYEYCHELHRQALHQYSMVCFEEKIHARGEKFAVMDRTWCDRNIQLGQQGQNYTDWFAERNIRIAEFTQSDLATISVDLLETATGVSSSAAITLKDIQQAAIKLMAQLTSYSLQYVAKINSGPIINVPSPTMRFDNWKGDSDFFLQIITAIEVFNQRTRMRARIDFDLTGEHNFDTVLEKKQTHSYEYDHTAGIKFGANGPVVNMRLNAALSFSADLPELPSNPRKVVQVLGTDRYLALTLDQQLSIPDAWAFEAQ